MKKLMVALAAAMLAGLAVAKEKVFILVAHPDDTLACAGTMFLMKDRFELHVMVLTHGERGNGQQGFLDGSTKAKRTKEEETPRRPSGRPCTGAMRSMANAIRAPRRAGRSPSS